jgi:CRISPR-associated protein Cmr4
MAKQQLLFLQTLTSLHSGAPAPTPLLTPFLREEDTAWPRLAHSTLRGALRRHMRHQLQAGLEAPADWKQAADQDPVLRQLFGAADQVEPGILELSDARLLALPVRSARGIFTWVTCPAVLEGLQRSLAACELEALPALPELHKDQVACSPEHSALRDDHLLIEEFVLRRTSDEVEGLTARLQSLFPSITEWTQRWALISNEYFGHLVRHVLPLEAFSTGAPQAPHYREFLPAETLMYAVASGGQPELMDALADRLPPLLQVGGQTTAGKGFCSLSLATGKEA